MKNDTCFKGKRFPTDLIQTNGKHSPKDTIFSEERIRDRYHLTFSIMKKIVENSKKFLYRNEKNVSFEFSL